MGTAWFKSGSIERDTNDVRAAAAKAYFYEGGTTTPLTVYQDSDESTAHSVPVAAASNGRWPVVFIPYITSYDVKVTTSGGSQLFYYTEIPNPDPVDVVGSGVTTTSEQILQTGDWLFNPKTGTRSGFVRANGRTIGSLTSGATERANADCQLLYTYLWDNFANGILAVTTGRGVSAAADWGANKPIALFDIRAGFPIGVDDMGNTAVSAMASVPFATGNSTTGGSKAGENTHTLITAELASHTHAVGTLVNAGEAAHTHTGTTATQSQDHTHVVGLTTATQSASHTHTGTSSSDGTHTHTYDKPSGTYTAGAGALQGSIITGGSNTSSDGGHTHTMTTGNQSADHTHTVNGNTSGVSQDHTHTFTSAAGSSHTHTISGATATNGSGTAHNVVSRCITGNWLIKL